MKNYKTEAKPIENSYWVIPRKLLAGEYPRNKDVSSSREKIEALLEAGISVFIDLTESVDGLSSYESLLGERAVHLSFPIKDVSLPSSKKLTEEILDMIDNQLAEGKKVYVHCWGGIGRTGIVIGCWLARHGEGGEAALEKLRELWTPCSKSTFRRSPETSEQERYILAWKEEAKTEI